MTGIQLQIAIRIGLFALIVIAANLYAMTGAAA
jgi:hypothetical protein